MNADIEMNMQIATLVVSIVSFFVMPLILLYLNRRTSKILEENKIKTEYKVQTYKRFFEIFNSVLTKTSSNQWDPKSRIDLVTDLIRYAPDEIVKKYWEFWEGTKSGNIEKSNLNIIFQDILLLMRRDLGYRATKISKEEILDMLLSEKILRGLEKKK